MEELPTLPAAEHLAPPRSRRPERVESPDARPERVAPLDAVKAYWPELVCVLLLLFLLAQRIWGLGPMHHDDGDWALQAYSPVGDTIGSWATLQGRIWAYVAGPIMLHILRHEGTVYGDLLKVGSFILFFATFYIALAAYFGRRLALLSALMFLGLMGMRWDGSILTAYPGFTWVLGAIFFGSVLAARTYAKGGGIVRLAVMGAAYFLSLFTNEGVTALCVAAFPVLLLAIERPKDWRPAALWDQLRQSRLLPLLITWIVLTGLYAVINIAWKMAHPTTYDGTKLAAFNLGAILKVTIGFSASSTMLNDFFSPYTIRYVDYMTGTGTTIAYSPKAYFGSALTNPVAWISGVAAAVGVYRVLARPAAPAANEAEARDNRVLLVVAFLFGAVVMLMPLLPVAASLKHQANFLNIGLRAYPNTVLAHFGISLMLATLLIGLFRLLNGAGRALAVSALAAAVVLGVLAGVASRLQDAIVNDIRPEGSRWEVMARTIQVLPKIAPTAAGVWAPRFVNGTWFSVFDGGYWTRYSEARYHMPLTWSVSGGISSDTAASGNWIYLDYLMGPDGRHPIILLAPLKPDAKGKMMSNSVAVLARGLTPSERDTYFLIYREGDEAVKQVRLGDLTTSKDNKDLYVLNGISAQPTSLRLSTTSAVTYVDTTCGAGIPSGSKVRFGTEGGPSSGCLGKGFLGEGWSTPEPTAIWSDAAAASLHLQGEGWPAGDVRLDFDLQGFPALTGRGGEQSVAVVVNGQALTTWKYAPGVPGPAASVRVPAALRGAKDSLDVELRMSSTFNQQKMGVSSDPRDLGVNLRSVAVAVGG